MESGFFSGLNFVLAGALFNHSACTNNHPLYYGVQYVHRGRFYLSVNNGPVYNLEGPALFLTDPEMFFSYGNDESYHADQQRRRLRFDRLQIRASSSFDPKSETADSGK